MHLVLLHGLTEACQYFLLIFLIPEGDSPARFNYDRSSVSTESTAHTFREVAFKGVLQHEAKKAIRFRDVRPNEG